MSTWIEVQLRAIEANTRLVPYAARVSDYVSTLADRIYFTLMCHMYQDAMDEALKSWWVI